MRITFLGTGAGEGIPAFLCNCPICREAVKRRGKYIRQNSAAFIESGSGQAVLLDMPPQIKMAIDQYRIDYNRLLAVLITHYHNDHTLGLKYLLEAKTDNGYQAANTVSLFLPRDVLDRLATRLFIDPPDLRGHPPECAFSLHPLAAYEEITVGPFAVLPLETNHLGNNPGPGRIEGATLGYLIRDGDRKKIAYLLDAPAELTERTYARLEEERIDCLVFDCTFEKTLPSGGHADLAGIRRVKERLKPLQAFASHISHRNLGHGELTGRLERWGIQVAYDGLSVTI